MDSSCREVAEVLVVALAVVCGFSVREVAAADSAGVLFCVEAEVCCSGADSSGVVCAVLSAGESGVLADVVAGDSGTLSGLSVDSAGSSADVPE